MALLRASGEHAGAELELEAVLGDVSADCGIPHAGLLVAFAEAAIAADEAALAKARDDLRAVMGASALSDAAGVIALFNAIDRVADSTGIPLEPEKAAATADIRARLGIDGFARRGE